MEEEKGVPNRLREALDEEGELGRRQRLPGLQAVEQKTRKRFNIELRMVNQSQKSETDFSEPAKQRTNPQRKLKDIKRKPTAQKVRLAKTTQP